MADSLIFRRNDILFCSSRRRWNENIDPPIGGHTSRRDGQADELSLADRLSGATIIYAACGCALRFANRFDAQCYKVSYIQQKYGRPNVS